MGSSILVRSSDFYHFVLKCHNQKVPVPWGLLVGSKVNYNILAYLIQAQIENAEFLKAVKNWKKLFLRKPDSLESVNNILREIKIVEKLIDNDAIDALVYLLQLNYRQPPFEEIDIIQEIVRLHKFNLIAAIIEKTNSALIAAKFEEALLENGHREKAFRIRQLRNQLNI